MALREVNGEPETFPPDIRSPEARSLYRLVARLGTSMGEHATRVDQRFVGFETKLDEFIGGVRLELWSRNGGKTLSAPPLPPMRAETPSSAILLEQANTKVVERLQEMAPRTPGPATHVDAKPEEIAKVVRDVVADVFQNREHASNAKFVRMQRKIAWVATVAFVTSVAGAAGLWTWGKAQGHAEAAADRSHETPAPK